MRLNHPELAGTILRTSWKISGPFRVDGFAAQPLRPSWLQGGCRPPKHCKKSLGRCPISRFLYHVSSCFMKEWKPRSKSDPSLLGGWSSCSIPNPKSRPKWRGAPGEKNPEPALPGTWHWGKPPPKKKRVETRPIPSGNLTYNYGTSPCYSWENPLFLWPFSIATLNIVKLPEGSPSPYPMYIRPRCRSLGNPKSHAESIAELQTSILRFIVSARVKQWLGNLCKRKQ